MPRESSFGKLNRHFHTHPRGRLHEFLFWAGIGVILGTVALVTWLGDMLATPLALMLAVVAACFVLWAFLPQKKVARPPPPKGKRGEIRQERAAHRSADKKRQPPPPSG